MIYVGIDYETAPVRPGCMLPPVACLAVAYPDGSRALFSQQAAEAEMERFLLDDNVVLVIAKAGFDMGVTCANYPRLTTLVFQKYRKNLVRCVLVRQKLMDLALGLMGYKGRYDLATVHKRHTGEVLEKDPTIRLGYGPLVGTDPAVWDQKFVVYACDDASSHLTVFLRQQAQLNEDDMQMLVADQHAQTHADFDLTLIAAWGMRTDAEGVERLRQINQGIVDALIPLLMEHKLLRWDVKKGVGRYVKCARVAQAMMLEEKGYENAKITKTGAAKRRKGEKWQEVKYISTDSESCRDCDTFELQEYARYVKASGMLSGHIKHVAEGVHMPIHTRFEVLLATGRVSSSSPNIMNVSRDEGARECYVPREGKAFLQADWTGAELHTLAQNCLDLFGYSELANTLNAGRDVHSIIGAHLAKMPVEEFLQKLKAGDEDMSEWRRRAKAANFGIPGGMGANGLRIYARQYGAQMTLKECKELIAAHKAMFPDVHKYLRYIRTNMDGETTMVVSFQSKRYRGRVFYCAAANSYFQGRAADGAKKAMAELLWRQYCVPSSALYGTRTVNFVHDEFILEVSLAQSVAAAKELTEIMATEFTKFCKDVPVHAEPCLMDRWSKGAKTIYNDKGELQLWRYKG